MQESNIYLKMTRDLEYYKNASVASFRTQYYYPNTARILSEASFGQTNLSGLELDLYSSYFEFLNLTKLRVSNGLLTNYKNVLVWEAANMTDLRIKISSFLNFESRSTEFTDEFSKSDLSQSQIINEFYSNMNSNVRFF